MYISGMTIPQDVINRLNELPIEEVALKMGMVIKNGKALCFKHDDHNPSLSFSKKKNIYRCWVCGEGGGPIKLVQEKEGWSFQEACIWLAGQFGIMLPSKVNAYRIRNRRVSKPITKTYPKVESENQIDREVGEWIVEHAALSSLAKHFLFEERKYKPEVVATLKVGSLTYPQKLTDALISVFGRERCANSSFFNEWKGGLSLCFRAPCLLFPYYDEEGVLYCIQSRFLGEVIEKKDRFKFPSNIKQRLFNRPILKEVGNNEPLFVCEGVTDCIAMLSSGKKAVAFPSSSICHPEDVRLLSGYYLFMYPDNDPAGEGLYKRLNDGLKPYSNVVHRLEFPEGFNDYSDYYVSML